jgi:hypothetical protein
MAANFQNVPVTSARKRVDGKGLYDVKQCFTESQCSTDKSQCSKCEICKSFGGYRIGTAGLPPKAYEGFPKSENGKYFYVGVERADGKLAKELKSLSTAKCLSIDPCSGPLASLCCDFKNNNNKEDNDENDENFKKDDARVKGFSSSTTSSSASTPWWVWVIVAVVGAIILGLLITIAVMSYRRSSSSSPVGPSPGPSPSPAPSPAG